jgi:glycosyltransferase involved in cell wall biosynthesis
MPEFIECSDGCGEYKIYRKGVGNVKYSFLVSAYNSENTIAASLESILAQSADDYEIVIIDDGSIDKTRTLIFDKLEKFSNFIFIVQSNVGLTKSLNRGVKHARGEWIVRQDADDKSRYNRLSIMEGYINSSCDFYVAKARVLGNEEGVMPRNAYLKHGEVLQRHLVFGNPFVHGTFIIKRTTLLKFNYNADFRFAQDYELLLRYLAQRGRIKIIPEVVYDFYKDDKSISFKSKDAQAVCARQALKVNGYWSVFLISSDRPFSICLVLKLFREVVIFFAPKVSLK